MEKQETRTIVDAQNGRTYIIDKKTNEIISSADRYGNIYNSKGKLVYRPR